MAEGPYPWFAAVTGPELGQGEILVDCPVLSPAVPSDLEAVRRGDGDLEAEVFVGRLVVMTQACDLQHGKIDSVVLCPVWTLHEMESRDETIRGMNAKARKKHWEKLRKGKMAAYHMLAE